MASARDGGGDVVEKEVVGRRKCPWAETEPHHHIAWSKPNPKLSMWQLNSNLWFPQLLPRTWWVVIKNDYVLRSRIITFEVIFGGVYALSEYVSKMIDSPSHIVRSLWSHFLVLYICIPAWYNTKNKENQVFREQIAELFSDSYVQTSKGHLLISFWFY